MGTALGPTPNNEKNEKQKLDINLLEVSPPKNVIVSQGTHMNFMKDRKAFKLKSKRKYMSTKTSVPREKEYGYSPGSPLQGAVLNHAFCQTGAFKKMIQSRGTVSAFGSKQPRFSCEVGTSPGRSIA